MSLPIIGKKIPTLNPENNIFFIIKAFAAGVILATGFIHILPDAFESLTSPCLGQKPWGNYPFTGFVAMLSAIGTLMIDTFATSYYKRSHFIKARPLSGDEEEQGEHEGHVHVHTHKTHGHAHGSAFVVEDLGSEVLLRHRVISQVLVGLLLLLFFFPIFLIGFNFFGCVLIIEYTLFVSPASSVSCSLVFLCVPLLILWTSMIF